MTHAASHHSSPYSLPGLIDTDALHASFERLCVLALSLVPGSREVLRHARRIAKAAKALMKAEQHNDRVLLKWEMLLSPRWRARVLKDLGGTRALKRWERSSDRAVKRRAGIKILKPHASQAQREARAINLAKAKAALFEKHREQPRHFHDDTHPNIYKDPCKVDFEGQFRLAPIRRGPRVIKTTVKVKPRRLSSGIWEKPPTRTKVTSVKINKINPIPLWPIEFEAVGEFTSTVTPRSTRGQLSHHEGDVRDMGNALPQALNTDSRAVERLSVPHHVRDDNGGRRDDRKSGRDNKAWPCQNSSGTKDNDYESGD